MEALQHMKLQRLTAVIAMLGLVLLGFSLAGGANSARADVTSLNLSATNAVFGQTITLSGVVTSSAGTLVTLRVGSGVFLNASVSSGEALTGLGTGSLSFTGAAGSTSSTITANYRCNSNVPVTFTLQQLASTSGPGYAQQTLTCSATGQQQLSCQSYTFNFSPTNASNAPCQSACPYQNATLLGPAMGPCSFPYPAQSQWLNSCPFPYSNPASNNYYYQNNPPSQFPSYSYPLNSGICSTPVAVAIPTVTVPSQLAVTLSKSTQGCDESNVITVEVRDASGNYVSDGTVVTLSSRLGTVNPNLASTGGGTASAVYIAPRSGGGTDVITAVAGTAKATANLQVSCITTSSPLPSGALPALPPSALSSVPTAAQPAGRDLPATPAQIFRPPNTGDAGLAFGPQW
jgi:hypothetical protein